MAGLLKTPGTQAFVAIAPSVAEAGALSDINGFVVARTAADEAEILTIAVATELRRLGAGRALLDAAMTAAQAQGAITLHLEVASNNEGARKFYGDAGFVETGRRARYYPDGADAILLSRGLA
jgi:[ribosomal protein S18]-alanine N-acetyltransferase